MRDNEPDSVKELLRSINEKVGRWEDRFANIETDIKEMKKEIKDMAIDVVSVKVGMKSVDEKLVSGKEKMQDQEERLRTLETSTQTGARCQSHTDELKNLAGKVSLLNGKTIVVMLVIASALSAGAALIVKLL